MDTEKNDLFAHKFSADESVKERFRSFMRQAGEPKVEISLEILAITFAVLLVFFIMTFYLGFSRGKHVQKQETLSKINSYKKTASQPVNRENIYIDNLQKKPEGNKLSLNQASHGDPVGSNPSSAPDLAISNEKPYTIQTVAYRSKARAEREVTNLQKEGYAVRLITKKSLFVVCVGAYANRTEAKRDLQSLKKRYHDCFLRKF